MMLELSDTLTIRMIISEMNKSHLKNKNTFSPRICVVFYDDTKPARDNCQKDVPASFLTLDESQSFFVQGTAEVDME